MNILVVGGDTFDTICGRPWDERHRCIGHWSGRKPRDGARPIPKHTDAVILILDRVSHTLARKVRAEALRRGIRLYYKKRGRHDADALWNAMQEAA